MFETPKEKTRRRWTVPLAMVGELLVVFFIAAVPARHLQLPQALVSRIVFAPRLPSAPPPPPPAQVRQKPVQIAARQPDLVQLIAPIANPVPPEPTAEIADATAAEVPDVPGGVVGGIPGGVLAYIPVSPPPAAPPPPPVVTARAEPARRSQISVGGDVQAGLLLSQVTPPYPVLAKAAHVSGTVELRAIIGSDGKVKELTVVSGHPLLVKAAVDAVKQWLYRPTLLNGEPVEVKTTISLHFKFGYRSIS